MQELVNQQVNGWKAGLKLLTFKELPSQLALLIARSTRGENAKKLQSQLTAVVRAHRAEQLKQHGEGRGDLVARLTSRANRYSAVAWKAYPLTKELRLTDDETRFMVAYATGCPWESLAKDCTCGAELTLEHLVCCRFGREAPPSQHGAAPIRCLRARAGYGCEAECPTDD